MAVKLRLTRVGSKKNPVYRVVAADSRSPRDGKFLEIVAADRPVDDRVQRRAGARLALEGRSALRDGPAAAQGEGPVSKEIVEYLARRLVDEPDEVSVEEIEREGAIVLQLHVAKDDVGKVIGRQGRIARALRTIVRASAARREQRVMLEILE